MATQQTEQPATPIRVTCTLSRETYDVALLLMKKLDIDFAGLVALGIKQTAAKADVNR